MRIVSHSHIGGEGVERFVKVVHLGRNAHADDDAKEVGRGMRELVVAGEGQLQGDTEALDGHDRNAADEGADAEVYEGI